MTIDNPGGACAAAGTGLRTGPLKVVVAAGTRNRPEMLAELIASWAGMERPEGTEVTFLVVENDEAARCEGLVTVRAAAFPGGALRYVHEPELGIPFARNRAAREAIALGADLLAFVDDDETVAADWLVRLVAAYRGRELRLLGGPVRVAPLPPGAGLAQRMVYRGVTDRYARKEAKAARRHAAGTDDGVTIVTNNWLGELTLFTEDGIWFDEEMRFTGGTDAKFHADARRRGIATGWAPDAVVYETIPADRLTLGYQYRRGRDQSMTHFRRKIEDRPAARLSVLVSVPVRAVFILALALTLPFDRGARMLDIARSAGWIAGRIGALRGRSANLYEKVTGS